MEQSPLSLRAFRLVMGLFVFGIFFCAAMVYYTGFVLPEQKGRVTHASPKR
jgi:hypothetical protein